MAGAMTSRSRGSRPQSKKEEDEEGREKEAVKDRREICVSVDLDRIN